MREASPLLQVAWGSMGMRHWIFEVTMDAEVVDWGRNWVISEFNLIFPLSIFSFLGRGLIQILIFKLNCQTLSLCTELPVYKIHTIKVSWTKPKTLLTWKVNANGITSQAQKGKKSKKKLSWKKGKHPPMANKTYDLTSRFAHCH